VAERYVDFASDLKYKLETLSKELQASAVAFHLLGGNTGEDIFCELILEEEHTCDPSYNCSE
jgi:hypothetical protein